MLGAVQRHNNLYSTHSAPPAIPILTASKGEVAPFPLSKFRVLLCDCYCAINEHEFFDKLSPWRMKGVHLGYDPRRRGGYFVWLPELQRITTISDVSFFETSLTALASARSNFKL